MLLVALLAGPVIAQNYNSKSVFYNTLAGGLSGGLGAIINKNKDQKWGKAFARGFVIGCGGGAIAYSGKKLNVLIAREKNLSYGWVSKLVFSTGNSIVENAASNIRFWERWHFDIGFVRLEFKPRDMSLIPRFMPSTFGGMLFIAMHGRLDLKTTLRSGTVTFRTRRISYAPNLVGSTTTNGFLFSDTLTSGTIFYDTYAHEMVHTFQFQEFSGINYFFKPLTDKWEANSPGFKKLHKWVYGDLNYEAMLLNYFIIQGGYRGRIYCHNFLENEAEFLTTGRSACVR